MTRYLNSLSGVSLTRRYAVMVFATILLFSQTASLLHAEVHPFHAQDSHGQHDSHDEHQPHHDDAHHHEHDSTHHQDAAHEHNAWCDIFLGVENQSVDLPSFAALPSPSFPFVFQVSDAFPSPTLEWASPFNARASPIVS